MNSPLLRPIYVFGTGLLLFTSSPVLSQAAGRAASMAPNQRAVLAQVSGQSGILIPLEVQEWQRQVLSLHQQGKYQEAARIQEKELAWIEQHLGPDHPDTAVSLSNLALMYMELGAYAKAEPLYRRALTIREKALGPDHADTALSLNYLAGLYRPQGAYSKAEPLFLRALGACRTFPQAQASPPSVLGVEL